MNVYIENKKIRSLRLSYDKRDEANTNVINKLVN